MLTIPAALALLALTSSPVTVVSETRPAFASLATVSVAVRDPGQAGPAIGSLNETQARQDWRRMERENMA